METVKDLDGNEITLSLGSEQFLHIDCMELMKRLPDKSIDLALVDPPYGHILDDDKIERRGGSWSKKYQQYDNDIRDWDNAPSEEYFKELFRVSKEQIVWGGNYFSRYLPPSRCFIVWHKLSISERFTMAMAEYAWASFNDNAKLFSCTPQGGKEEKRFHPCSKPIPLYEFCLQQFAKPGQVVLDTHAGSGSSLIACHNFGCYYIGCEINDVYYKKAKERIEKFSKQLFLFDPKGAW